MNLYDALLTRRTVHRYQPEPVPDAVLDRLLLAAHHAPNHKLTWPWRFTRVGPKTRVALFEVGVALKETRAPLSEKARAGVREKMLDPGALVVVSQVLDADAFRRREDYAATCCAIQNLQLAAHAVGLGAKWSTGDVTQAEASYAALGIDPAVEEIVGFIWIGVPAEIPSIGRPDVSAVTRSVP
ncbi:MAG: nitroreductase [Myxococcales bacterium]|nr:nitroreductase [Myxococcales bacterium]